MLEPHRPSYSTPRRPTQLLEFPVSQEPPFRLVSPPPPLAGPERCWQTRTRAALDCSATARLAWAGLCLQLRPTSLTDLFGREAATATSMVLSPRHSRSKQRKESPAGIV